MIEAWRLVRARHKDDAFSGEGSKLCGGRWHRAGIALVYASSTLSLAVLETVVRLVREYIDEGFVYFKIEIPAEVQIYELDTRKLPKGWRQEIPIPETQDIGSQWAISMETAVLKVPSVLSPAEFNYVLNPDHQDFKKIIIGKPEEYRFDKRLAK